MIEVYPKTIMLQPGEGDRPVQQVQDKQPDYWPFHLLLSVPTDRAAVDGSAAVRVGARGCSVAAHRASHRCSMSSSFGLRTD
jgi:hypothetical protein